MKIRKTAILDIEVTFDLSDDPVIYRTSRNGVLRRARTLGFRTSSDRPGSIYLRVHANGYNLRKDGLPGAEFSDMHVYPHFDNDEQKAHWITYEEQAKAAIRNELTLFAKLNGTVE